MAAPIAQELERLLNPQPGPLGDPEDDPEDATAARVVDKFDEGGPEDDLPSVGLIWKGVSSSLLDADQRYRGKATSRKALEDQWWDEQPSGEEETDESDLDSESLEEELDDDEDPDMEEEEEEEKSAPHSVDSGEEKESCPPATLKKAAFCFQAIDDFEKFAEGMDEIESGDEEEEGSMEEGSSDEAVSEEGSETEDEVARAEESKGDGMLLTFSEDKVAEEVEKGRAVKNQIALWDQLLKGRIKLQKALMVANRLPQPDTFPRFKKRGGTEFTTALKDNEQPSGEEETDESDLDSESLEEKLDDEDPDMEEEEEEEEEESAPHSVDSGEEKESCPPATLKKAAFCFQAIDDFEKFAEGMDEIESGDEEEEGSVEEGGSDEAVSEEGSEAEDEVARAEERKGDGMLLTFSEDKVAEEVEKGRAVKNQIALWDQLLEGRIKLQKALMVANRLPQPDTFPRFKKRGGTEFTTALKDNHKALKALLRALVDLQDELLYQYSGTRHLVVGGQSVEAESMEEIPSGSDDGEGAKRERLPKRPLKRKLAMDKYPEFAAKRFADFRAYRNSTLQKWHDKTKLASGKLGKGFGAFERSVLTQIEHILMDKERLLRRTQTKRSVYRVLGKPSREPEPLPEALPGQTEALPLAASNAHLKDLDEEIFDDDDFYHQLLRELIERKTSCLDPNDQVAMGRQWLAIQKLRSKIRKKVDRKASKGRKIRYHVHSKLVSFMAPIDHCTMNDDARTELYRSLFGRRAQPERGGHP